MTQTHHNKNLFSNNWVKYSLLIITALVLLRLITPMVMKQFINHALQTADGITGQVEAVELHLLDAAYDIKGISIYSVVDNTPPQPLLDIKRVNLSILIPALFRGRIVSQMQLHQPELIIFDQEPKITPQEQNKLTNEETWIALANDIVIFSIDQVSIQQGKITLINQFKNKQTQTYLGDLNGKFSNITNSEKRQDSLVSKFSLTGKLMGESKLSLYGALNPFSEQPNFDFNAEIQRFDIAHLDSAIKFYTPFDIELGSVDGAMELVCHNGKLKGYLTAGIYDLNVFSWEGDIEEDNDGPATLIFENIVELFGNILENSKSDLVAAKIPISGTVDNTKISTLQAVISILHNAFIKAFEMKIEDIISYDTQAKSSA
ncbi:DUF748 domain-containing protein [Catenovulum sp. 2E275]|uniref:DUF748 domain-containing protein n=1 Tax=Catenovulum sp. 2E275 TaxID=2980497 RepID=UPI0021CF3E2A|nr:DUF748 domain-containing protein [Catenovulum sp. 2E275]MCU4677249.1 DUF748 domain-containing protein [Catenovulum sp. 2E275]